MNIDDLYMEKKLILQNINLLEEKLKAIESVIILYGVQSPDYAFNGKKLDAKYPAEGSRKQKILFILEEANKSLTVEEIRERIKKYDPSLDFEKFPINQYCSGMAKNNEIGTDNIKVGNKNKYFFVN